MSSKFCIGDLVRLSAYGKRMKCNPKRLKKNNNLRGVVVGFIEGGVQFPIQVQWFSEDREHDHNERELLKDRKKE